MSSWFSFLGRDTNPAELPNIYPMPILQKDFVTIDVQNIFSRILTDTFERTHGIPDDEKMLIWDSCMASDVSDGLVTMLAKAMSEKQDLFIVYIKNLKLIRKATAEETAVIREGYKKKAEPVKVDGGVGIFVTFKNFKKADMVKFYSALEWCSVGGLWKQSNLSQALQLKFKDMRASISQSDAPSAKTQAEAVAKNLAAGKDVAIDGEDTIETAKPDVTATNSSLEMIQKKQALYLGMPASYLIGEGSTGLSDTGKADSKSVDRGLKNYFFSIVKPVSDGIFGVKTEFKSEDSEGISSALEVLKTMDTTSNEFLSQENKTKVVNKAFGLDEDEVGDEPETPPVVTPPPGQPPAAPPPPAQQ